MSIDTSFIAIFLSLLIVLRIWQSNRIASFAYENTSSFVFVKMSWFNISQNWTNFLKTCFVTSRWNNDIKLSLVSSKAIVSLVSNLDKMIVKTNIFNRRLSIATLFRLNFVITIIINTFKTLLINRIKIINIVSLSKTFNNNLYYDLLKLLY